MTLSTYANIINTYILLQPPFFLTYTPTVKCTVCNKYSNPCLYSLCPTVYNQALCTRWHHWPLRKRGFPFTAWVHCLYILFKLLRPGTVWNQALCPLKKFYNKWPQDDTNHRLENALKAWNSRQPLHQIWPLTAWNDFNDALKRLQNILLENSPVRTVHFRTRKIRIIDNVVMFINITKNGNYCI